MKTVAIIQARMGSTRFAGKTLHDLCGRTLLERVIERVARARRVEDVVVATTEEPIDDDIERVAGTAGVTVFRGSTDDVLDRYVQAARRRGAGIVIRNTADEPFLDPGIIDDVAGALNDADYSSNNLSPLYPEGLDTEAVRIEALETAWSEATKPSDREHVTPFIWRQPERFRLVAAGGPAVHPEWRLTVDYPADLEFARAIYTELGPDAPFGLRDVVALLESRPDLLALCPSVPRREGYMRSVEAE